MQSRLTSPHEDFELFNPRSSSPLATATPLGARAVTLTVEQVASYVEEQELRGAYISAEDGALFRLVGTYQELGKKVHVLAPLLDLSLAKRTSFMIANGYRNYAVGAKAPAVVLVLANSLDAFKLQEVLAPLWELSAHERLTLLVVREAGSSLVEEQKAGMGLLKVLEAR